MNSVSWISNLKNGESLYCQKEQQQITAMVGCYILPKASSFELNFMPKAMLLLFKLYTLPELKV